MSVRAKVCEVCPHTLIPQQYQQTLLLLNSLAHPSQDSSVPRREAMNEGYA